MTSRYNVCNSWACSVVVIALHLYTKGPRFEPGLLHKACYMPLWLLKEAMTFFSVTCHSLGRVHCTKAVTIVASYFFCYLLYVLY